MYDESKKLIALSSSNVQAGFPSPADDFMESELNLHDYLVHNSKSTFMVRVSGDSMIGAGILSSDILIVDRSAQYKNNSIIIAVLDGDLKGIQQDFFDDIDRPKRQRLIESIDKLNREIGRDTVRILASGTDRPWMTRRELLSNRYTTNWNELKKVY